MKDLTTENYHSLSLDNIRIRSGKKNLRLPKRCIADQHIAIPPLLVLSLQSLLKINKISTKEASVTKKLFIPFIFFSF